MPHSKLHSVLDIYVLVLYNEIENESRFSFHDSDLVGLVFFFFFVLVFNEEDQDLLNRDLFCCNRFVTIWKYLIATSNANERPVKSSHWSNHPQSCNRT